MSQGLPIESLFWMKNAEVRTAKDMQGLVKKNMHRYLLKVDGKYPKDLIDSQNELLY